MGSPGPIHPAAKTEVDMAEKRTREAVVARQAQVADQLPPIAGKQRAAFSPVAVAPPEWWAEARIPLDDAPAAD